MNTTVTTNINQVDRTASTSNNIVTKITSNENTPFQPETRVNIENSIRNMLTMLSKTGLSKEMPIQEMPKELQKLINDLLQNAFSIDSTVSQGLSDVLQSQRLTIDQLNLLTKFIDQISTLMNKNEIDGLPEMLKTLLANVKLLDGQGGKVLDSITLNKLAFQLLEGKSFEELPEALQFLLLQNSSSVNIPPQQVSEMNFLKQLIKSFFPSPSGSEPSVKQPNNTNNQQASQNAAQANTPSANPNTSSVKSGQVPNQSTNNSTNQQSTQANTPSANSNTFDAKPGQVPNPSANNSTNQQITQKNTPSTNPNIFNAKPGQMPNQSNTSSNTPSANQSNASTTGSAQSPPSTSTQNALNNQTASMLKQPENRQPTANTGTKENPLLEQNNASNTSKHTMLNTVHTMQVMKNLASQLLAKPTLPSEEFTLLKNFMNDNQNVLGDKEVKQLQNLIRMSEENLPAVIRQAAIRQNIPELPKIWAFVQLCNLTRLLDLSANRLKNASKSISDFAAVLKKTMKNENEVSGNQRSMSFLTPLYLGDNEHCYPTYIHVYNETSTEKDADEEKKETWLRLCLLTENIGAVELVFRLYEKENVNLRVAFSDESTVNSFNEYIPELQLAFDELPLTLTDIKVNTIGGQNE